MLPFILNIIKAAQVIFIFKYSYLRITAITKVMDGIMLVVAAAKVAVV